MIRGILGFLGQVLAWLVILVACAALLIAVVIPRIGGGTPYTILTSSMTPAMPPGTLVVDRPVDPDDLAVGDVVTYQLYSGQPTVVTHRIVAIRQQVDGKRLFRFKGDANSVPDARWVMPVQIRGKRWYYVPFLGRLNVVMSGRQHQWAVYAVAAALFGYAGFMFVGALWDRRRRGRDGRGGRSSRGEEEARA